MAQKYGKDFTHIAVRIKTQRKIAILASVQNIRIYDLVREWVDDAWEDLKIAGKVNDGMLEPTEREVINA